MQIARPESEKGVGGGGGGGGWGAGEVHVRRVKPGSIRGLSDRPARLH